MRYLLRAASWKRLGEQGGFSPSVLFSPKMTPQNSGVSHGPFAPLFVFKGFQELSCAVMLTPELDMVGLSFALQESVV